MSFGPGGFGGGFGRGGTQPGMPFGGIPSELQDAVDKIMTTEPERAKSDLVFDPVASEAERARLSLGALLREHPALLAVSAAMVVIVAITSQVGPALTGWAINAGMSPGHEHLDVVIFAAIAYLVVVFIGSLAQRRRSS